MRSYVKVQFDAATNSIAPQSNTVQPLFALQRLTHDQMIYIRNLLAANYIGADAEPTGSWYLYDNLGNVIRTFDRSFVQTAIMPLIPYANHPLN